MHSISSKQQEFDALQRRVAELEQELAAAQIDDSWRKSATFYPAYAATTGFLLGGVAAVVALLVNIFGAMAVGRHPLDLIRIYLTFPLGAHALVLTSTPTGPTAIDDRMILIMGICLYLGTGMLIGSVFQVILSAFTRGQPLVRRVVCGGVTAVVVWLVNFYGVLIWLQPLVCGGDWIVNPTLHPIWVAAGTHVVYGCVMGILSPLGEFQPALKSMEHS